MGKRVVILGAGIGGLVAAHELRRRLGKEHHIILIDREAEHRFQASYLWVMMGWREPHTISRPLAPLQDRGIDFRQAEVHGIDVTQRRVETSTGPVPYDFLVIALGAELAGDTVPGLAETGYTPYTLEGAAKLRETWQHFEGGRLVMVIASTPFKCPAAPYEAAFLLESGFRKRGGIRGKVDLQLYTPEKQPMPVAGPAVGQALQQMLEERGIGYHPNTKVTAVDPGRQVLSCEDGSQAGFELLLYIPTHRSPAAVRESGLADQTGWIPVNGSTLLTSHEQVYALGDVAAIKLSNGMMLPRAGVFAHGEAEVVAQQIVTAIEGKKDERKFAGWGACFIEMGDGKAGYGSGNFLAMPAPMVRLHHPTGSRHLGKVLFEKAWLLSLSESRRTSAIAFWAMNFWGRTLLERHWLWRWL